MKNCQTKKKTRRTVKIIPLYIKENDFWKYILIKTINILFFIIELYSHDWNTINITNTILVFSCNII